MTEQDPLNADHKEVDKILDQAFTALRSGDQRQALAGLGYFWPRFALHIRGGTLAFVPEPIVESGRTVRWKALAISYPFLRVFAAICQRMTTQNENGI